MYLTVLLVEDDSGAARLVTRALEKAPAIECEVERASCVAQALELIEKKKYDVVLLDLLLPDASGISSISKLRAAAPDAAIVVLTNLEDQGAAAEGLEAGAQEFLVKDEISPALLPKVLRYAVSIKRSASKQHPANLQLEADIEGKSVQLENREEEFRHLIDAVVDYAIVTLDSAGKISAWNSGAERLYGYGESEVFRKDLSLFFEDSACELGIPSRALASAREQGRVELEGVRVRKDGSTFRGSSIIRPLSVSGKPIEGFVFVTRDVTELYEVHQRALQAERLAAIGQMVTGLAHESRNALQRIQASVNRIVRRSKDNPEILQMVSDIENAGEDLVRLYDAVREYASPVKLQKGSYKVLDVWRKAWEQTAPVRKGHTVSYRAETCNADLHTGIDEYQLGQVFRNLIENSLAACPDPIELLVQCREREWNQNPALMITVSDNGPGISEEHWEKVFDAFFTTRRDGTGLGMAIVKKIIEAHGGHVQIESPEPNSPYQGARVSMIFPHESDGLCKTC